jgi:endonuclease YncB( thermonuclease family)
MYEYNAEIISVYDGDTVRAIIDLGFGVQLRGETGKGVKLRLSGLNTPEVRGEQKEAGLISRDRLRERILGKNVILKTFKDATGKYGRYIAEIHLEDENINEWLITEGLAERREY